MDLSTQIEARGATYRFAGTYAPEYRPVVDAFVENFRVEDEIGAACSILLDGRTVVDVYGGWRDGARAKPWDAPTTVCMRRKLNSGSMRRPSALNFTLMLESIFSR